MLRDITSEQLREWQLYDELDPFGSERDDYRFASIPLGIRKEVGRRISLDDFLVRFGDALAFVPRLEQSVEYQEMLIDAWVSGSNAIFAAKKTRQ